MGTGQETVSQADLKQTEGSAEDGLGFHLECPGCVAFKHGGADTTGEGTEVLFFSVVHRGGVEGEGCEVLSSYTEKWSQLFSDVGFPSVCRKYH